MATRNRLSQLRACLRSIARQTVAVPVQVCVVNDGGDSIVPVVEEFQREHPDVEIWFQDLPQNHGQVFARNLALTAAKGEWIAFCDDDDRWLPTHLSSLLSVLQSHRADWVHADAELVELRHESRGLTVVGRHPFAWRRAPELLRRYNPIIPSTVLYRKQVHVRLGRFDESVDHYWDWDFWLRLCTLSPPVRVPVASVLYGIDQGGGNASADLDRMRERLRTLTAKHRLGELPAMNFLRMLERPDLAPYRAPTRQLWDGDMALWQ